MAPTIRHQRTDEMANGGGWMRIESKQAPPTLGPDWRGQAQLAEFKTALKGWTRSAGALPALATSICATARERGKYTSQPSIEGQSGKQAWVSCRWEGLCSALLTCSAVGIVNTEHTEPTYRACNFRPESVHAVMFRGSTATTDSPAKNADNGRSARPSGKFRFGLRYMPFPLIVPPPGLPSAPKRATSASSDDMVTTSPPEKFWRQRSESTNPPFDSLGPWRNLFAKV
uniref:Uncharacterized protein n=1 Tax=Coccidioides posadasii RMSCC 3488 TaxID=454284 RepID=A0A0J6IJE4_COCPO|nr:hypothetical protein CPAG_08326 [Coccidioides posadasii RMSCC 3488]